MSGTNVRVVITTRTLVPDM